MEVIEMKVILGQLWENVSYGKSPLYDETFNLRFSCWSALVLGEGDKSLKPSRSSMLGPINWIIKHFRWKKYIILYPKIISKKYSTEDVRFQIGFYSKKFNVCKVSSAIRYISDGPFAMRMGPEDCHFFIVADGLAVELEVLGYVKKDLDLY